MPLCVGGVKDSSVMGSSRNVVLSAGASTLGRVLAPEERGAFFLVIVAIVQAGGYVLK